MTKLPQRCRDRVECSVCVCVCVCVFSGAGVFDGVSGVRIWHNKWGGGERGKSLAS